jgi:hypothetical protein
LISKFQIANCKNLFKDGNGELSKEEFFAAARQDESILSALSIGDGMGS